jgi:hypothetical protein
MVLQENRVMMLAVKEVRVNMARLAHLKEFGIVNNMAADNKKVREITESLQIM